MNKNALIVFLRKPERGKVKTRLARDIGDTNALRIYQELLEKTFDVAIEVNAKVYPLFTPSIPEHTNWSRFDCRLQKGKDIGECMKNAFEELFNEGFEKVIIIGSDCYSINKEIIQEAFESLDDSEYVIGPAEDGGYYLLGMQELNPEIFENIEWSTDIVFKKTIEKLSDRSVHVLSRLNDIDTIEDLKKEPELLNLVK